MLNVEFVKQFSEFGAILAGFSMAIAYSFILHKCNSNSTRAIQIGGAFLVSAIFLILGVLLAAWTLTINAKIGEGIPPSDAVLSGAKILLYLTAAGGISLLVGIGLSGFMQSKNFGRFTAILAILGLLAAVVIFASLS